MMVHPEPEEKEAAPAEAEVEKPEPAENLQKALEEEREKAERYFACWQRAQADYQNLKRCSQLEKEEICRVANANLILSLVSALDDLEKAFAAIPPELEKQPWVEGIRLIERKIWQGLEKQGLSRINAIGEPFDPRLHEGVAQVKGKAGMVLQEVEKGYILNDRVIRPARVIVGSGEDETEKDEAKEA
jgi:molecular chaperone GrpE